MEEPDYVSAVPDASMDPSAVTLSQKGWEAMFKLAKSRGYDTDVGRRLYHDISAAGLVDVQAEGFVAMQLGGTPSARFWRLSLEQLQDDILSAGLLTRAELDAYRKLLESPDYRWLQPMMMSVRGRRVSA